MKPAPVGRVAAVEPASRGQREGPEDNFEKIFQLLASALEFIREKQPQPIRDFEVIQREYEAIGFEIRNLGNEDQDQLAQLSLKVDDLGKRALTFGKRCHGLSNIYDNLRVLYQKQLKSAGLAENKVDSLSLFARECLEKERANFLGALTNDPRVCALLRKLDPKFYDDLNYHMRESFDKKLKLIEGLSDKKPTCFICYNVDEKDVVDWVRGVLIDDLREIGVIPVWSKHHLFAGDSVSRFMERASTEDFTAVVCTPALIQKYQNDKKSGVAVEIKEIREHRLKQRKDTTIPIIFKSNGQNPNEVNPLSGGVAFWVESSLKNYLGILNFFASLKAKDRGHCREIAERYIREVEQDGVKYLENLLQPRMQPRIPFHQKLDFLYSSRDLRGEVVEEMEIVLWSKIRLERVRNEKLSSQIGKLTVYGMDLDQFVRPYLTEVIGRVQKESLWWLDSKYSLQLQLSAQIFYELGAFDDAISIYQTLLKHDHFNDDMHSKLGRIFQVLGRPKDAEKEFLAARFWRKNSCLIVDYANFLFQQNRYDEAIAQLMKIKPCDEELMTYRGVLCSELVEGLDLREKMTYRYAEKGLLCSELAEELEHRENLTIPTDQLAYFLLAKAYLKTNQLQKADESCRLLKEQVLVHPSSLGSRMCELLHIELGGKDAPNKE